MNTQIQVIQFSKAAWYWLIKKPSVVWLMATVLLAAGCVAFWPETSEPRIRITGWVLELFGLATVAWGLQETRRQFGRPNFLSLVRAWWTDRPRLRLKITTGTMHATLGGVTGSATGYQVHGTSPTSTLEDRVVALEANLRGVNERVDQVHRDLIKETFTRKEAFSNERKARENEDSQIRQKLESVETGGLHISMVGVVWLTAGLTFSTVSNELLCIFK